MSVPLKILLVEDDPDDYFITKTIIEEIENYAIELQWETNHLCGLQRLQREQFDICLTDYRIGIETGIDFIADANASDPNLPVILITGVNDYTVDVEASEAGATDFIEKTGLTSIKLERAIRYSLSRSQQSKLRRVHNEMARANLENDLREAVVKKQFEVYLQPEINIETMRIDKAEALVRWNHPTRGVLGPGHFIQIAERSDLIIGIGRCVIDQVCHMSNRLNAVENQMKIAFNVSIAQMERHDFADTIAQTLAANRTDASNIEIEITESVAMREPRLVRSHMDTLKSYGIRFAVDDFGTGYSGLATLKDFPFDIIKIDRAFVQAAAQSPRNQALAKTIFYLADVMQLDTVAEGVETEAQFAAMKNLGATYAQGYLFKRPQGFDEFRVFAHRFNWQKNSTDIQKAS